MSRCGLCEHFDQTQTVELHHTCKLEDPRKWHDPASDACDHYKDKGPQQDDMRARGAFRQVCEVEENLSVEG